MGTSQEYFDRISSLTDEVLRAHPEFDDHRRLQPWLTGWLGDPTAPVWFVAENPSSTQVDRVHSSAATVESQWAASRGDRLLREALVEHGLKTGGAFEPGGWRCYLTDVMKSKVFVRDWNGAKSEERRQVAQAWAPVLRFEIEQGRPKVLIVLGGNAFKALHHLEASRALPTLPRTLQIEHYSYVMQRPDRNRNLPPADPIRQLEWRRRIGEIIHQYGEPL